MKFPWIILFFLVFLLLGLAIVDDFGVHWDEFTNQRFGHDWGSYVEGFVTSSPGIAIDEMASKPWFMKHDVIHGPFFEIVLYFAAKVFLPSNPDPSDVILLRHTAVFLLFSVSCVFFYLVGVRLFRRRAIALAGTLMLILHPRIFADVFYNSVDLAVLSLYIISTWTLFRYLDKPGPANTVLHALACAVLVDVRVIGAVVPLLTVILVAVELGSGWKKGTGVRALALSGVAYLFLFADFMILFWPFLWADPVGNFFLALMESTFTRRPGSPSPFYNFEWIGVTTPPLYLILFVAGLLAMARSRGPGERRSALIALYLFFVPIGLTTVMKTDLFDGWRHHYFVYPAFVLIAMTGVTRGVELARGRRVAVAFVAAVLGAGFLTSAAVMVRLHPHEFVYANFLAGKDMHRARENGALDYWALSCRDGLEYILRSDDRERIRVFMGEGQGNRGILPPMSRVRLEIVHHAAKADYFVTSYRSGKGSNLYDRDAAFSLSVDGERYLGVYKLGK